MRAVLNDLLGQRLASLRLQYYLLGAGTAAMIVAVLTGLQVLLPSGFLASVYLVLAIAAGAIGAFMSTAIRVSERNVDLSWQNNTADSSVRIVVGCTGAAVLFLVMNSDIIAVRIGSLDFSNATWQTALLIGFLGGFAERLVPNLSAAFIRKVGDDYEISSSLSGERPILATEGQAEAEVARAVERLEDRLARLQVNPLLDNFNGTIEVQLYGVDSDSPQATPHDTSAQAQAPTQAAARIVPGRRYKLRVQFRAVEARPADYLQPNPSASSFQEQIRISNGNTRRLVTFEVGVDSRTIAFSPSDRQPVTCRAKGQSSLLLFEFEVPKTGRKHELFVEAYQKSRLVQVIPIPIDVEGGLP